MGGGPVKDIVVGGALVLVTAVTAPVGRRRYNRWGATDEEVASDMPGDQLVPHPRLGYARAITIDAPPSAVWPWLVQIGQGRGGMYSYDGLENLARCDIHSTQEILPEHQSIAVGSLIRLGPEGYPCFRVDGVVPESPLVLVGADPEPPHDPAARGAPGGLATWQWMSRGWAGPACAVVLAAGAAYAALQVAGRISGRRPARSRATISCAPAAWS